jgi:hypothetical protein
MVRTFAFGCLLGCALVAGEPVRQVTSQAIIAGNQPVPAFYAGYVYFVESGNTFVRLYAPDGQITPGLSIGGRTPGPILMAGVAVDSDGTVAVSRATGGGDGGPSAIEFYDGNRSLVGSIDTGLYVPAQITFAPDRTVWSFGWEWSPGTKQFARASTDYMMVRQFSRDGKLLGAWLPRSTFPKGLLPASESWQARRITVIKDRVGLLADSGTVGTQQEWVEMDLQGKLLGRWRLDEFLHVRVGLTPDGNVYLQKGQGPDTVALFTLDRAASTWKPVASPMNGCFYGVDGDQLVFSDWAHGPLHLFWFQQP